MYSGHDTTVLIILNLNCKGTNCPINGPILSKAGLHDAAAPKQLQNILQAGYGTGTSGDISKDFCYLPPLLLPGSQWEYLDPCHLFCWHKSSHSRGVCWAQAGGIGPCRCCFQEPLTASAEFQWSATANRGLPRSGAICSKPLITGVPWEMNDPALHLQIMRTISIRLRL